MITVVTPSIRENGLDIVARCLRRQTFTNYEFIVVSPFKYISTDDRVVWIQEPNKRQGDNYNLNKAWNAAFRIANGELIVSIVDLLWFPPDTLEKLWIHYQADPKKIITTFGHQYDKEENSKPEHLVWYDPLKREEMFYEIEPIDCELCLTSIPKQAIIDVGGVDEYMDRFAALSEKEMCIRMKKAGYSFWRDQSLEFRALKHPRLTKDWDEKYQQGIGYFNQCISEINSGKRLKLNYLTK